jgi:hypothetical protein
MSSNPSATKERKKERVYTIQAMYLGHLCLSKVPVISRGPIQLSPIELIWGEGYVPTLGPVA